MTETALSEEAMRKSLLDIRLPPAETFAPFADLLLAAGLGGIAALVLIGVLRVVTRRTTGPAHVSLKDRIAALQALPEDARRVGFLHLLKEIDPERHAELKPHLYRPGAEFDPETEVQARV